MAFGWGRRVCSGQGLAEQGTFITIARLLWGFRIQKAKDANGQEIPVDIFNYTYEFDSFATLIADLLVVMASTCDPSLSNATSFREAPRFVTRSSARERRPRGGSQCTTGKPSIPSVSTIRSNEALASRIRDSLVQFISANTHVEHLGSVKWIVRYINIASSVSSRLLVELPLLYCQSIWSNADCSSMSCVSLFNEPKCKGHCKTWVDDIEIDARLIFQVKS
jgi:hypothetical protein